jgi:hypothetical protein
MNDGTKGCIGVLLKDEEGLYQRGNHKKDDRLRFEHHTKKIKIFYFSTV